MGAERLALVRRTPPLSPSAGEGPGVRGNCPVVASLPPRAYGPQSRQFRYGGSRKPPNGWGIGGLTSLQLEGKRLIVTGDGRYVLDARVRIIRQVALCVLTQL